MIDLRNFFTENVSKDSSYYKFLELITDSISSDDNYEKMYISDNIHSEKEVIGVFKELVQPRNDYSNNEKYNFLLVCYYLYKKGYYIRQFPDLLNNYIKLETFAYNSIRNKLVRENKDSEGTVAWSDRRLLIEEMEFLKIDTIDHGFENEVHESFKLISTRGAEFDEMPSKEKLKEIANFLEYLMKIDKKYRKKEEEEMLYLVSDNFIKEYRSILQCYRHSDKDSIKRREELEKKENYLLYIGIGIIHGLNHGLDKSIRRDN